MKINFAIAKPLRKAFTPALLIAALTVPAAFATYDQILAVTRGGTGATTSSGARSNLGAAASGANSDITSLTGLTTALSVSQGGTGATTAAGARTNLGLAIGTDVQAFDSDLAALAGTATTGVYVVTGTGTSATRTITGTTNTITVTNGTGVSGNPTLTIADNPVLPGTGSVTLPIGTTAQRPGSPVNGMGRYNSTTNKFEYYENGAWVNAINEDAFLTITTHTGAGTAVTGVNLNNATGGAFTLTLPAAATAGSGAVIHAKKTDSSGNAVTVDGDGAETIDGATTYSLSAQYQNVTIVSDGSNWHIL